jgi:hypothetical protein
VEDPFIHWDILNVYIFSQIRLLSSNNSTNNIKTDLLHNNGKEKTCPSKRNHLDNWILQINRFEGHYSSQKASYLENDNILPSENK